VLANLIVNAFIYNDSKEKRCTVKVERLKDGVCIKVKDNGRGFDAQRFGGVIFDRHRESLSGEGLGLLIAKCFCERYGGVLDIDSDESGTCVTMTFYDDDREPSRNFAQIPDYDEEEINCVQYVLSKFFRGVRPDMSLLVPEPEEEEN
jgi:light-regulated signal transduction histidine kinase (bacteriophytochrome)